jgi:hypothetical protein
VEVAIISHSKVVQPGNLILVIIERQRKTRQEASINAFIDKDSNFDPTGTAPSGTKAQCCKEKPASN